MAGMPGSPGHGKFRLSRLIGGHTCSTRPPGWAADTGRTDLAPSSASVRRQCLMH